MRYSSIVNMLKGKLPQYTNAFSEKRISCTITFNENVISITTPTPHGLVVGNDVTLSGFGGFDKIDNYFICKSHKVDTVISPLIFTIKIVQKMQTGTFIDGYMHSGVRVISAMIGDWAKEIYTSTSKTTAFVIDGGMTLSRDRGAKTDATLEALKNTDFTLTFLQKFGVLCFVTTPTGIMASTAVDDFKKLDAILLSSLVGQSFDTDFEKSTTKGTLLTSAQFETIEKSFTSRLYTFETIEEISNQDLSVSTDTESFEVDIFGLSLTPTFT